MSVCMQNDKCSFMDGSLEHKIEHRKATLFIADNLC